MDFNASFVGDTIQPIMACSMGVHSEVKVILPFIFRGRKDSTTEVTTGIQGVSFPKAVVGPWQGLIPRKGRCTHFSATWACGVSRHSDMPKMRILQ